MNHPHRMDIAMVTLTKIIKKNDYLQAAGVAHHNLSNDENVDLILKNDFFFIICIYLAVSVKVRSQRNNGNNYVAPSAYNLMNVFDLKYCSF